MIRLSLIALACCLAVNGLTTACRAQTYPGLDRVLEQTAQLVEDQFVDAATARRTAEEIRRRQAAGQYEDIETADQLQRRLTEDLRSISGDTHIGVVEDRTAVARYRARAAAATSPTARQEDADAKRVAEEESRLDNYGLRAVEVLPGGVGYLRTDYFDSLVEQASPAIAAAMNMLAGSDAIIIDLRHNGGGSSKALPLYLSYFPGPETVTFALRRERWRDLNEALVTQSDVRGARHYAKPIYILTSGTTYSLAEQFTYHLKALGASVVIVGERTYGGGNGWDPVVLNDDFYLRLPRVAFTNISTGTIFPEGEGIAPDIAISASAAKERAYVEALERLTTSLSDRRSAIRRNGRWRSPKAD